MIMELTLETMPHEVMDIFDSDARLRVLVKKNMGGFKDKCYFF